MTREMLGVALWRWSALALGLFSLAGALVAAHSGDPFVATCLHPDGHAGLGHCPLCWAAGLAFLTAATPSIRTRRAVRAHGKRP
jgi:hypothetical protein